VPSGLWLGKASANRRLRGALLPRKLIAGISMPFDRLDGRMGDDMQAWCDVRSAAASANPELISDAAEHYYLQVANLLKYAQPRAELDRRRRSIRHKVNAARLASLATTPARLQATLQSHPSTRDPRKYSADDPPRLASRLSSEAENELHLMLAYIYRLGHRKLVVYQGYKPASAAPVRRRRHPRQSTAHSS
jgi:hypothetical protein